MPASEPTGRIWGVVFSLETLPRLRSFLQREKRLRTVYTLASLLKGGESLASGRRDHLTLEVSAVIPGRETEFARKI